MPKKKTEEARELEPCPLRAKAKVPHYMHGHFPPDSPERRVKVLGPNGLAFSMTPTQARELGKALEGAAWAAENMVTAF